MMGNEELELFEDTRQGLLKVLRKRKMAASMFSGARTGIPGRQDRDQAHIDDIFKWPEVSQLIKDGALPHKRVFSTEPSSALPRGI